jgi:hypothetical protein
LPGTRDRMAAASLVGDFTRFNPKNIRPGIVKVTKASILHLLRGYVRASSDPALCSDSRGVPIGAAPYLRSMISSPARLSRTRWASSPLVFRKLSAYVIIVSLETC